MQLCRFLRNSSGYPISIAAVVSAVTELAADFRYDQAATFLPPSLCLSSPLTLYNNNISALSKKFLTFNSAMGVRNRLKERKNQLLSHLFQNRPAAIEASNVQKGEGHQDSLDPNAELHSNGSMVSQIHTNKTVERTDAPPAQSTSQTLDNVSIRELWNVAWENLQQEDHKLVEEYELKLQGSVVAGLSQSLLKSNIRERMSAILGSKMEEVNRNAPKLTLGNSEVKIKDAGEVVLSIASSANDYITQAVSANPSASIAWAGVSFLLPVSSIRLSGIIEY